MYFLPWFFAVTCSISGTIGVIIEFPDKNRPHILLATATGATARKDSIYDVILLEYLATGCYRCYSSQGV